MKILNFRNTFIKVSGILILVFSLFFNINAASAFFEEEAPMMQTAKVDCYDWENQGYGQRKRRCVVDLSAYCDFDDEDLPSTLGTCDFSVE
jgi:hypothetical protein